jgi:hypothetical protein
MNVENESIDFKAVFGDGAGFSEVAEAPNTGKPCLGATWQCPPFSEMTIVTEPLELVCTCTPEETAYRQGAEDMRKAILMEFDHLWDRDECTCYRCLKAVITDTVY